MQSFFSQNIWMVIGAAIVILLGFYAYNKWFKKKGKVEHVEGDKRVYAHAFVHDMTTTPPHEPKDAVLVPLDQVEGDKNKIPTVNYNGKWVYHLLKTEVDKYTGVPGPKNHGTSTLLWLAMQHYPDRFIAKSYLQEDKPFFQKYGQILVWGAIMAFIGYLYMSQ